MARKITMNGGLYDVDFDIFVRGRKTEKCRIAALLRKPIALPFVPFPGLQIRIDSRNDYDIVSEVEWRPDESRFVCQLEDSLTQPEYIDEVIESLVNLGFILVDDLRDTEEYLEVAVRQKHH